MPHPHYIFPFSYIFKETNFGFYDSGVMSVFYNILKFIFHGLFFISIELIPGLVLKAWHIILGLLFGFLLTT